MATLVLKRGSLINPTVSMVFPEGGVRQLARQGIGVAFTAAGGSGVAAKALDFSFAAQKQVHTWFLGGITINGTVAIYSDRLEFTPVLKMIVRGLYENIDSVTIPIDIIRKVEQRRVRLIYPVIDLTLEEGTCRLVDLLRGPKIHDALQGLVARRH